MTSEFVCLLEDKRTSYIDNLLLRFWNFLTFKYCCLLSKKGTKGAKIHNLMLFFTLDFDHTYEFVFIHLARNEAINAITCHFLQQYCHFKE